tara:strand:- start:744 stop:1178 length:435 start_codon:yes stop_codon:yes gene_type:complete
MVAQIPLTVSYYGENTMVSDMAFTLSLSELLNGNKIFTKGVDCAFTCIWDLSRNLRIAYLDAICGSSVNIMLHPKIQGGTVYFNSDMKPVACEALGTDVLIHRISLGVNTHTGERKAAVLLQKADDFIEVAQNFDQAEMINFRR